MQLPPLPQDYVRVAAAVCLHDGKLLIARRKAGKAQAGLWELPGGKVEAEETLQQCLEREIDEELGMQIKAGRGLAHCLHRYSAIGIQLIAVEAQWIGGEPQLKDHDRIEWIQPREWIHKHWAAADIPLLAACIGPIFE